jgi:hypothetical protein
MCKSKLAIPSSPPNRSSIPCGRKSCADSRGTVKRENILLRENTIKRPSSRACCAVSMHVWPHSVSVRCVARHPDCQVHSYSREEHEENTSTNRHTYRHRHTHTLSHFVSISTPKVRVCSHNVPETTSNVSRSLSMSQSISTSNAIVRMSEFVWRQPCPRMCCTGEHIPQENIVE